MPTRFRLPFALLFALILMSVAPVFAQTDGTLPFTFSDGTRVDVPPGWQLDADRTNANHTATFTRPAPPATDLPASLLRVYLFSAERLDTLDISIDAPLDEQVIDVLDADTPPTLDDFFIDAVTLGDELDVVRATFAVFGQDRVVVIYARQLGDDRLLLAEFDGPRLPPPPPGTDNTDRPPLPDPTDTLTQVIQSAQPGTGTATIPLETGSVDADANADADDIDGDERPPRPPRDLPTDRPIPLEDIIRALRPITEVATYTFPDDTLLRFPADWELFADPAFPDIIELETPAELYFVDHYDVDLLDEFDIVDVLDAMEFSYIPFDDDFEWDADAVAEVTFADLTLYVYRYNDGGEPGTQIGVELPTGAYLVMDAFGVRPASRDEALALVIMLDAAGEPDLFEDARTE